MSRIQVFFSEEITFEIQVHIFLHAIPSGASAWNAAVTAQCHIFYYCCIDARYAATGAEAIFFHMGTNKKNFYLIEFLQFSDNCLHDVNKSLLY